MSEGLFSPSRLKVARERRGLTKQSLAALVSVSTRIVVAYESGEKAPSEETVQALVHALKFPRAFFFLGHIEMPEKEAASFRALTRMRASQRDEALAAGALAGELSRWLEERFDFPAPDVPGLRDSPPELAAEQVRERWGLGVRPAPNMVHLLEAHGVRVFSLAQDAEEVDAFSMRLDGRPMVFMNTMKSVERSRFDAAHELGHLVLHRHGLLRSRELEQEADRFASSFLMPRASVLPHAPRVVTVDRLADLKCEWGVSVSALARRLYDLSLITEWQYRSVFLELGKRDARKAEPNPIPVRETSRALSKTFVMLKEDGVSKGDVAKALGLPVADLEALIFGLLLHPGGVLHSADHASRR